MTNEETQTELVETASEDTTAKKAPEPLGSPEDYAAMFFQMNQKKLKFNLSKLSMKQLKRVIYTAASYPLVDREYAPKTEEEKNTVFILNEMLTQKTIMQLSVEMQKAEEAMKAKEENNG